MFPIYLKNYRNYIHNICDILHLWVWFKSLSNYLFIPVFSPSWIKILRRRGRGQKTVRPTTTTTTTTVRPTTPFHGFHQEHQRQQRQRACAGMTTYHLYFGFNFAVGKIFEDTISGQERSVSRCRAARVSRSSGGPGKSCLAAPESIRMLSRSWRGRFATNNRRWFAVQGGHLSNLPSFHLNLLCVCVIFCVTSLSSQT